MEDNSTLKDTEPHPSAKSALLWLQDYTLNNTSEYMMFIEAISIAALSGNRLAEVLLGTLNRLESHQPVSDRYLLGLAWSIHNMTGSSE